MTIDNADTIAALEAHGQALATIARILRQASAVQWHRAPGRQASVDPSHVGGALDPVPVQAGDSYRLRVRGAVITAESALATSADVLNEASAGLERAVDEWHGARVDYAIGQDAPVVPVAA